jgi:hypothetical protein
MAEFPDAHKTDPQKTWGSRDIKLREVEGKRKLPSSIPTRSAWLALTVFRRLALAVGL